VDGAAHPAGRPRPRAAALLRAAAPLVHSSAGSRQPGLQPLDPAAGPGGARGAGPGAVPGRDRAAARGAAHHAAGRGGAAGPGRPPGGRLAAGPARACAWRPRRRGARSTCARGRCCGSAWSVSGPASTWCWSPCIT
jgi:hypothetical protein